jgi:ubiquinol-cytochrome c reductase cytochrome c subunit
MRARRFISRLAAVSFGLGVGWLLTADRGSAASVESGKQAYLRSGCWGCHGTVGQGGVAGPRLAPDPLPPEAFAAIVRTSNRAMPPYRESVLSDQDLADIYAYMQSIPQAADHRTIPLLAR